jgi:(2Fe-2S) ferredoxin
MEEHATPYLCHVFVCVNRREDGRKACGGDAGEAVRARLKQVVADRDWRQRVRVSQCGCLGKCSDGPNVMMYPQQIWFSRVTEEDLPAIEARIAEWIGETAQ